MIKNIPTRPKNSSETVTEKDDVLRFFIIGDYGELDNIFGVRTSTLMMDKLAKLKSFEHIVTAGDNFYNTGIDDINYRFKPNTITQLFNTENLHDLPIYATLGNHD